MNKKFIVLLAAYEGQPFITEQLNSIFSQADVDVHVFASIDPSKDQTEEILRDYASHESRLTILEQGQVFGSAAKNFFRLLRETDLEFVDFDYLAFSDQDDIWDADKLKHAAAMLEQAHADAYSSNVYAFWAPEKRILIDKAQPQTKFDYMFESAGPGCSFVLCKKLAQHIHRCLKQPSTQYDQIVMHDWFIYAFARSKGYQWLIDPDPKMLYRQHQHNVIGANSGFKPMLARIKKMKQGWYRQQILLIANSLGYDHRWPITALKNITCTDRLSLALHAAQCRRRLRDKIAFAVYVLFLARR